MILQALCDYYDRKEEDLPPFGFEEKAIPFIIVIDEKGRFINLDENQDREDGKTIVRSVRVPRAKGRSGAKSYETAYCLWDHYGYIAAQPKPTKLSGTPTGAEIEKAKKKAIEDAQKQHLSFKEEVARIKRDLLNDPGVKAVDLFLNSDREIENLKADENWQECIKKNGTNLAFRISGETHLACQSEQVIDWVKRQPIPESEVGDGFCLITGKKSKIARLHNKIDGITSMPAALSAINNNKNPSFASYGKDQGFNFPVSAEASFKYTTSINHLLRKASLTKFRLADTSYVCWAERSNQLENTFFSLFTDAGDDPDSTAQAVKSLFSTIHNGAYQASDGSDKFFVLGLAPNSARIVVRYWKTGTIAEFSENIARWFNDLEIIKSW